METHHIYKRKKNLQMFNLIDKIADELFQSYHNDIWIYSFEIAE